MLTLYFLIMHVISETYQYSGIKTISVKLDHHRNCGKRGFFLKTEKETGLCLSCNERFAQEGKIFTERMTAAENEASIAKDPKAIAKFCQSVENYENELLALHQVYNLHPSQELLDLVAS
jgi:hypothetical protein